jgi:hypothetical protein
MGKYDSAMKFLLADDPSALVQLLLEGTGIEIVEVKEHLSTTFPGKDLSADALLLVTTKEGYEFLLHLEFQVKITSNIGDRLFDYNHRAQLLHKRPVVSCVIFLREEGAPPKSPLVSQLPNGTIIYAFSYVGLNMWELTADDLYKFRQTSLLPLLVLTKNSARRTIVESVYQTLLEQGKKNLLPVSYVLSALVLEAEDLSWLERMYQTMLDELKESPAYHWMTDDARKEEYEANLAAFRQTAVDVVAVRFPSLVHFAQKQVQLITSREHLQQLILQISIASDASTMEHALLHFDGEDEVADELTN